MIFGDAKKVVEDMTKAINGTVLSCFDIKTTFGWFYFEG